MKSWNFNGNIPKIFDIHVEKSVPLYNDIQNLIIGLGEFFIKDNSNVLDIGCSTGKTIINLIKNIDKCFYITGIDLSEDMIKTAIENTSEFNNVTNINLFNNSIVDIDIENFDYIISNLTLQFLSLEDREIVCRKVYNGLNKGGAFIVFEKIYSENPIYQDMYNQLYYDFKEENGFTDKEIRDKEKSLRGVLRPIEGADNLRLLKSCGFMVEECFRYLNFVGYLCIKN